MRRIEEANKFELASRAGVAILAAGAVRYSAISRELRQFGLVAGKNLVIEYRFHNVPGADIAAQVAELVQSDAAVLVADGPESVLKAAVAATRAIPTIR